MFNLDLPDPVIQEKFGAVTEINNRALILATRVALRSEVYGLGDLYSQFHAEIDEIRNLIQGVKDLQITYSGQGFMPLIDGDSGRPETGFCEVKEATGKLNDIYLLDPSDTEYVSAASIASGDDDEPDSGGIALSDNITGVQNGLLRTPETCSRLYLEFLTGTNEFRDQYIGGLAIRSDEIRTYNIMDVLKTEILQLDDSEVYGGETIPVEELASQISRWSYDTVGLFRSRAFRRQPANVQQEFLDEVIDSYNAQARIDRYGCFVSPERLFYIHGPSSLDPTRRLIGKVKAEPGSLELQVQPIKLDTLESFRLLNGKPIKANRDMVEPKAGLCIVAKIPEGYFEVNGEPVTIVWIPISNQDLEGHFYPKNLDL